MAKQKPKAAKRVIYSKKLCDELLPLFKDGSTVIEVCQALGITRKSYYQWKVNHIEFSEAAEFAEEAAEAAIAKLGREALYKSPKSFNTGLYCFAMKTRFGYRETDPNPNTSGVEKGQPLTINFNVSPAVDEVIITNAQSDSE